MIGHRVTSARDVRFQLGLPVSSPADAWCELAAVVLADGTEMQLDDLIAAGDRLVDWPRPLVTLDEVDAGMRRYRRGRGIRSMRRARAELRAGSASPRETRLRLLVLRTPAGYPEPEPNGPIDLARDGWLVIRIHKDTTDAAALDWLDAALRSRGWRP